MRSFLLELALNSKVVQLNDNKQDIEENENNFSDDEFETDDKVITEVKIVEIE